MSHWITNWVIIEGNQEDIARVKASLTELNDTGEFDTIDFDKLVPTPEELLAQQTPDTDPAKNAQLYGAETVEAWRLKHWGTEGVGVEGKVLEETPTMIFLSFSTEGAPPFEFYGIIECEMGVRVDAVGDDTGGEEHALREHIWLYHDDIDRLGVDVVVQSHLSGDEVEIPYAELSDDAVEAAKQQLREDEERLEVRRPGDDTEYFGIHLDVWLLSVPTGE